MIDHDLAEQLIIEAARVRDEVMAYYVRMGAPGENACRNMARQLDSAIRALYRHDEGRATRMLAVLKQARIPSEGRIKA